MTRGSLRTLLAISVVAAFIAAPAHAAKKKRFTFSAESAEEVEGKVHKPEVGYVLTRQEQEDLETLQLKESFLPKIIHSLEKKPF